MRDKALKEIRRTELPPVYEPLLLNCEFLYSLADSLSLTQEQAIKAENILHPSGEALFLTKALDDRYHFGISVMPPFLPGRIRTGSIRTDFRILSSAVSQ